MQERTSSEWLPILQKRLRSDRQRTNLLNDYYNGDPPLPTGEKNMPATWTKFQKKACLNLAGLAVNSLADRIIPAGSQVVDNPDMTEVLQTVWRDNRLDIVLKDIIKNSLTTSKSYGLVELDEEGKAVISFESSSYMYAAPDPIKPWKARAAIKVWADRDYQMDYAVVWHETRDGYQRTLFSRSNDRGKDDTIKYNPLDDLGRWDQEETVRVKDESIPIGIFNNADDKGEFEPHTDLIDRINEETLQRLTITNLEAFRQRVVKGTFPPYDDNGDLINYESIFNSAPGALWMVETDKDHPASIEQLQSTDITPLLEATKNDIRDFAAVTRTPNSIFQPDSANQSAEGAAFAKEGLVFKAEDRIKRFSPSLTALLAKALKMQFGEFDGTVKVAFMPPDRVSINERYSAATQAISIGEPFESVARNILNYDDEQIKEMTREKRREEAMRAFLGVLNESNEQVSSGNGSDPEQSNKNSEGQFSQLTELPR